MTPPTIRGTERQYADEVLSHLTELLTLNWSLYTNRRLIPYQRPVVFFVIRIPTAIGLGIAIAASAILFYISLQIALVRGLWLQRQRDLNLSISFTAYVAGCLCNLLFVTIPILGRPICLTLFVIYVLNFVFAHMFTRSSQRKPSQADDLMRQLHGSRRCPTSPSLSLAVRSYYMYLSILHKLTYAAGRRRLYCEVTEELSAILDLSNQAALSEACVTTALAHDKAMFSESRQHILLRRKVRLASLKLTQGNLAEAHELLGQIEAMPVLLHDVRKKYPGEETFFRMTRARLMAYMYRWDDAISLLESVRSDLSSRLAGVKRYFTREKALLAAELTHAVHQMVLIYCTTRRLSDAVTLLSEHISLLDRAGERHDVLKLKILVAYLQSLIGRSSTEPVDGIPELKSSVARLVQSLGDRYRYATRDVDSRRGTGADSHRLRVFDGERDCSSVQSAWWGRRNDGGVWSAGLGFAPDLSPSEVNESVVLLALTCSESGDHEGAVALVKQATRIANLDSSAINALMLRLFEATLLLRGDRFEEASASEASVRAEYRDNLFVGLCCTLFDVLGALNGGAKLHETLAIFENAASLIFQIRLSLDSHGAAMARELLRSSKSGSEESSSGVSSEHTKLFAPLLFLIQLGQALGRADSLEPALAVSCFEEAVNSLEDWRVMIGSVVEIAYFKTRYGWIYDRAVEVLFEQQQFDQALLFSDRLRCVELFVLNHYRSLDISEVQDRQLVMQCDRLRECVDRLMNQLRELEGYRSEPSLLRTICEVLGLPEMVEEELMSELRLVERELDVKITQLRRKHPRFLSLQRAMSDSFPVLSKLPERSTLIYLTICQGRLLSFVCREHEIVGFEHEPEERRWVNRQVQEAELQSLTETFCHALQNRDLSHDEIRECGRELFSLIVEPWLPIMAEYSTIYIVPDGPLFNLPFHALVFPKSGQFLLSAWNVVYLPNLAFLNTESRESPAPPSSGLVVYDPDTKGEFERLPGAVLEMEGIREIRTVQSIGGDEATKARFKQVCDRCSVIHIAAHSVADVRFRYGSFIRMAGWPDTDCRLFCHEIAGLNLEACELCSLSTCRSGFNAVGVDGEVYGLANAFLAGGARAVVAAFWNVSDEFAPSFMEELYSELREHSPGTALRRVQLHASRREGKFGHSRYWAPFYVIGRG